MAEQKIDIKIQINKDASVSIKSLSKEFGNIKVSAKDASMAAKQLGVDIQKIKAGGNVSVVAKDFTKLRDAMSGASAASGGATASVLELGRVISDAPYGIRGVANNLQQLASNFAFMAKQAGGAGAAMKAIGSALVGPLGILIAFQAVVAAIDFFSNRINKAKKDAEGFGESLSASTSELQILIMAMSNENVTQSERIELVDDANKKYKDLNLSLKENGRLTEESVRQIDNKIAALTRLARANFIQLEVEKELNKIYTLEFALQKQLKSQRFESIDEFRDYIKATEEAGDITETRELQIKQFGDFSVQRNSQLVPLIRSLKEFDETSKSGKENIQTLITSAAKGDEAIRDIIDSNTKTSGAGSVRMFKQQLLNLQKFILDTKRLIETGEERNQIELLKIRQKYEQADLLRRKESFIEKQKQRLEDFKRSTDDADKIAEAQALYNEAAEDAEDKHEQALTLLRKKHTIQRNNMTIELQEKFDEEMVNQRLKSIQASESRLKSLRAGSAAGSLGRPMSAVGAEDIEGQNEAARRRMAAEQANFEDDLQRKIENLTDEGFSLLQAEQMVAGERHAFQMSQAEQEIELERNKLEAKKNINQEYVSWVQGLSGVFKSISGENEALATAALVLEKGAAIAGVIIRTQRANAEISSNMLAEQAAFNASAAATSLVAPAVSAGFKAAAVTAGVMGKKRILKNNIGAGISIAKIAATTLQSRGGASGGGGGGGEGGGGGRTFDFNLVGSTGQDQLAQAVGGQFSQGPVQAYVVSSQMTSQQQLDNIIESDATFGGDN